MDGGARSALIFFATVLGWLDVLIPATTYFVEPTGDRSSSPVRYCALRRGETANIRGANVTYAICPAWLRSMEDCGAGREGIGSTVTRASTVGQT